MVLWHPTRCHGHNIRPLKGNILRRLHSRCYASAAQEALPQTPNPTSALAGLRRELDQLSPRFEVQASQIQLLQSPESFYETLKRKILEAQSRIYLSTLYIGKEEHDLIAHLRRALLNRADLKLSILTDALRGTRETPQPSTASLLAPLVSEFSAGRVEIRMYHTPNLTGIRKRIIPRRINEGWGLQHMKLYGFDDEVILSGANLSHDYFTNRQDRYHIISSKQVANYFGSVHNTMCKLSYLVQPETEDASTYTLRWPESNAAPSPLEHPSRFVTCAGASLNPLIRPETTQSVLTNPTTDTVIYPLAQLTPLLRPDTSTEYPALKTLLQHLSTSFMHSRWMFTAGYFNIRPEFKALLLASKCDRGVVVTASPWANGFYGSNGVSGMLPAAYSLLSRRFLDSVRRAKRTSQIELKEWRRGTVGEPGGWTYHAKGLWVTLPGEENPAITLVGSSNYTKRSYSLDLEMNMLVITENVDLRRRLRQEQEWLQEYARKVEPEDFQRPERRVGIHVRIAMWIVSLLGGAL